MSIKGKLKVNIKIGKTEFKQDALVTNLGKLKGIIGMDFLQSHRCELKLSEAKLVIEQQSFNLRKHTNHSCARVKICENRVIPPQTEIFIKGYIDGDCQDYFGMNEPDKKLQQQKGIFFAKSLNTTTEKEFVLSVLNMNNKSVKLNKNLTVGTIDTVQLIEDQISSSQTESKNISEKFPEHLLELLLSSFLNDFQDIFVGPDNKLGQTDIVKHKINTGSAKPVKVPHKRIPTALQPVIEKEI